MPLSSVEELVKQRIPFLSSDKDPVISSFKQEVYYEVRKPLGIEDDTVKIEDDSNYTGLARSLVADIVTCYMVYHLAVENQEANADGLEKPVYGGDGLNDIVLGGSYTGEEVAVIEVEVTSTGTPDQFRWRVDGGDWSNDTPMTTHPQFLADGITISFEATNGHTTNDKWLVKAVPTSTSTGGTYLKSAAAGSTSAEFAVPDNDIYKKIAGNSRFEANLQNIWETYKMAASRKAGQLGFVLDVCNDCQLLIDSLTTPKPFKIRN